MKKFIIKDEDGMETEVIELDKTKREDIDDEDEVQPDALTSDEIAALKKLAAVADKLIGMTTTTDEDGDEDDDVDVDVDVDKDDDDDDDEVIDSDEEEIETKKKEEVIDCSAKMPRHDSKRSVGAITKKKTTTDDSVDDQALSIEDAWAKRYNGGNR